MRMAQPEQSDAFLIAGDAALFSAALMPGGPLSLVAGPVLAWALHRRRFDGSSILALLLGLLAAVALAACLFGIVFGVGVALERIGLGAEESGLTVLLLGGLLLLGLVVALTAAALTDLRAAEKRSFPLDVARLLAAGAIVVGGIVFAVVQWANPASGAGDAGPFAVGAAFVGGASTLIAGMLAERFARRG
jgi:hypothetical protein